MGQAFPFYWSFTQRRHLHMALEKWYEELLVECKCKLGRELTEKEVELLGWIKDKQMESVYQQVKTS
jgi:hypothetical protein